MTGLSRFIVALTLDPDEGGVDMSDRRQDAGIDCRADIMVSSASRGWRRISVRWFVPCLLILVWILHLLGVELFELNRWKGGGFGMFSVLGSRDVYASGTGADGAHYVIDLSNRDIGLISLLSHATMLPTRNVLEKLGRKLKSMDLLPSRSEEGLRAELAAAGHRLERQGLGALPAMRGERLAILRLRSHKESPANRDDIVRLNTLRLQVRRAEFDPSTWEVRLATIGPEVVVDMTP